LLNRQGATTASGTAPGKGSRGCLRRNPTELERNLWRALTNDRRFAGQFKRNVPIGPHVTDFLAQHLRLIIEVVPEPNEDDARLCVRERQTWLR
jgi:tRNA/rRNA methyltransferase